jgi:hypothetical protein
MSNTCVYPYKYICIDTSVCANGGYEPNEMALNLEPSQNIITLYRKFVLPFSAETNKFTRKRKSESRSGNDI